MLARLRSDPAIPDRDIATRLQVKLNTMYQNIVRARKFLESCLADKDVPLEEVLR